MKNENPRIHKCKNCKCIFKILTQCKHGTYYYVPKLYQCPQCDSYDIKPIEQKKFDEFEGVWFRASKKYGKKVITFSIKK